MDYKEKVQQWLEVFGSQYNMKLEFDEDGWCSFSFDEVQCDFLLFEDKSVFRLISPLMPAPDDNEEGILRWLLEQNFLKTFIRDAVLAIDPEYNEVVLFYDHSIMDTDSAEDFISIVTTFIDIADKAPKQFIQWMEEQTAIEEAMDFDQAGNSGNKVFV